MKRQRCPSAGGVEECAHYARCVPDEVWDIIFAQCEQQTTDTVFRLACVSHRWRRLCDLIVRRLYVDRITTTTAAAATSWNRVLYKFPNLRVLHIAGGDASRITNACFLCLTRLVALDLSDNSIITGDTVASKAATLKNLHINGTNNVRDPDLAKLTNLTTLSLSDNGQVSGKAFESLPRLKTLRLAHNNYLEPTAVQSLVGSLTKLDISGDTTLRDAALASLTNLTSLNLLGNRAITDLGISGLSRMRELRVMGAENITDAGLRNMHDMTYLMASYAADGITDAGIARMTRMTRLDLNYNNHITDTALVKMTALNHLELRGNASITSNVLKYLTNLTHLTLDHKSVNFTIDDLLRGMPPVLKVLDLSHDTLIEPDDLKVFASLTGCQILY